MPRREREDLRAPAAAASPPSPETLEARARQIAEIEHPEVHRVTEEDRERALAELTEMAPPTSTSEATADYAASRNPAEPVEPEARVHRTAEPEDAQQELESTVLEGAREAEHQTMLEARRSVPEEELGD